MKNWLVKLSDWEALLRDVPVQKIECIWCPVGFTFTAREVNHYIFCDPKCPLSSDELSVLDAARTWIENYTAAHRRELYVLRLDPCTLGPVKQSLGRGEPRWYSGMLALDFDGDERLEHILDETYPDPDQPVKFCLRPWTPLKIHKNYPVEFRVYCDALRPVGISSYYPQRPLDYEGILRDLQHVLRDAHRIATAIQGDPRIHEGYTLDFGIRDNDYHEVVFIEGGPPSVVGGADPCCFWDRPTVGVALSCPEAEERERKRKEASGFAKIGRTPNDRKIELTQADLSNAYPDMERMIKGLKEQAEGRQPGGADVGRCDGAPV